MTTKKIERTSRFPLPARRFITIQDHPHPLAAVAFDLDSTLTKPYLDFAKLRAQLGLAEGDILDWLGPAVPGRAAAGQGRDRGI